jgi:hypothetical protein
MEQGVAKCCDPGRGEPTRNESRQPREKVGIMKGRGKVERVDAEDGCAQIGV